MCRDVPLTQYTSSHSVVLSANNIIVCVACDDVIVVVVVVTIVLWPTTDSDTCIQYNTIYI